MNNLPVNRNAIEQFAIDYDVPLELAVKLIGRTEQETAANIESFKNYIAYVVSRHRERMTA